jgi:hypothetical protein
MPTPFTHLVYAQHLLSDPAVPDADRALINANRGAYLLGSVVADAHALAGLKRDDSHFYSFDQPMEDHPWRVMFSRYPSLREADTDDWRAFLAGYVMHLSMDEIWSLDMTGPEFAGREWAPQRQRFLMLHILLITLDERDLTRLDASLNECLRDVRVQGWLPFLSDDVLRQWETLIYRQIMPGGESETLTVYGLRVGKTPEELRVILDSPEQMQADLWSNVTREKTAEVEAHMLDHARAQMIAYLRETEL